MIEGGTVTETKGEPDKKAVKTMNHLVFDMSASIIFCLAHIERMMTPIHLLMVDHAKALCQWEIHMSQELCAHLIESFVLNEMVRSPIHW